MIGKRYIDLTRLREQFAPAGLSKGNQGTRNGVSFLIGGCGHEICRPAARGNAAKQHIRRKALTRGHE